MLVKIIGNRAMSYNEIGDIGILVGNQVFVEGRSDTINHTAEGDYVEVTHVGGERVIEAVRTPDGHLVVVIKDSFSGRPFAYTTRELTGGRLTLKEEEKPVELTLEEVANKFGIDVKKLRIKE